MCQTANLNRQKGKSPYKIDDFLLFQNTDFEVKEKELSFAEMKSLQAHVNAILKRQQKRIVTSVGQKALTKKKNK